MPYSRAERVSGDLDVHVDRLARAKVHLRLDFDRLARHEAQREAPREHDRMRVHFDQGEMLADARARAEPERKVHEAIARRTASGRNRSGSNVSGCAQ